MKHLMLIILLLASTDAFSQKQKGPSLKGSKSEQRDANRQADREKRVRIKNDKQLKDSIKTGYFVPITKVVKFDDAKDFDPKFRFVLPVVNTFLVRLESGYQVKFGKDEFMQLNSAVRTEVFQDWLEDHNDNAAKSKGKRRSLHLTGMAVDITKKGMTEREIIWVRSILISLERQGLIEATEESCQAVFHIVVYQSYAAYAKKKAQEAKNAKKSKSLPKKKR